MTKQSPFKVAYKVDPLQLVDLALKVTHLTLEFNQDGEDLEKAKLLEKAQKCYDCTLIM